MATDLAIRGAIYGAGKGIDAYLDEDNYGSLVFGDKDAVKKIQGGSYQYKKGGTEYINSLNGQLNKKIKTPSLNTSSIIKKESNALLVASKGNSTKLLNTISSNFSKQCISFKENSKIPGWMLNNSAKQNRALASSFYACVMEMSKKQQQERMFGGKKMTIQQVSQRAYDYARAADAIDKHHAQLNKRAGFSLETQKALDDWDKNMAMINAVDAGASNHKKKKSYHATSSEVPSSTGTNSVTQSQGYNPYSQQPQQSPTGNATTSQTTGWGNALEQMGLSGFSDVSKNMGYVLAMLPDMLIGMFTGKNPNLKIEDNLLPLASIAAGLLVKRNPLLKMILLGYGGLNIFSSAGTAALKQRNGESANKTYRTYADESLSPRISNPVVNGRSMVADIDGVPTVIEINKEVIEAYEKGHIPLNTLANAVLTKYDENRNVAAQHYEHGMSQQQGEQQTMHIK